MVTNSNQHTMYNNYVFHKDVVNFGFFRSFFVAFSFFFRQFIIVLGRQLEVVQLDWIKILEKKYSFLKLFQGIFVEFYENSDAICNILTGKPARHQLYTKKTKKVLVVILWCFFLILIYYANNPYTFQ